MQQLLSCKSAEDWPIPFDEDKFFFVPSVCAGPGTWPLRPASVCRHRMRLAPMPYRGVRGGVRAGERGLGPGGGRGFPRPPSGGLGRRGGGGIGGRRIHVGMMGRGDEDRVKGDLQSASRPAKDMSRRLRDLAREAARYSQCGARTEEIKARASLFLSSLHCAQPLCMAGGWK